MRASQGRLLSREGRGAAAAWSTDAVLRLRAFRAGGEQHRRHLRGVVVGCGVERQVAILQTREGVREEAVGQAAGGADVLANTWAGC